MNVLFSSEWNPSQVRDGRVIIALILTGLAIFASISGEIWGAVALTGGAILMAAQIRKVEGWKVEITSQDVEVTVRDKCVRVPFNEIEKVTAWQAEDTAWVWLLLKSGDKLWLPQVPNLWTAKELIEAHLRFD